jgi:hypothetical protein
MTSAALKVAALVLMEPSPLAAPVHVQHWVVNDQRTVKTPFIPASACPGTVQR